MAAFRRVYDSHHLQADSQEPGSAPEPYATGEVLYFGMFRHGRARVVSTTRDLDYNYNYYSLILRQIIKAAYGYNEHKQLQYKTSIQI